MNRTETPTINLNFYDFNQFKYHIFWFKTFLNFSNGIPFHDTFERVFQRIDLTEFYEAFSKWTYVLAMKIEGIISIDGKPIVVQRTQVNINLYAYQQSACYLTG